MGKWSVLCLLMELARNFTRLNLRHFPKALETPPTKPPPPPPPPSLWTPCREHPAWSTFQIDDILFVIFTHGHWSIGHWSIGPIQHGSSDGLLSPSSSFSPFPHL